MKKHIGITRNKIDRLASFKKQKERKKNRFQIVGKQEDQYSDNLSKTRISEQFHTESGSVVSRDQESNCSTLYHRGKNNLNKIAEIQKKISTLAKARLSSFKQSQNEKYDEKISKLAIEATNYLISSEKILKQISQFQTNNVTEKKFAKNLELSLASQIRQLSRGLRQQQKEYFSTIKSYEKSTVNSAIELTEEQKKMMINNDEIQVAIEKDDGRSLKINELVGSINKLSGIYKQLNQLVIEQGTLIDRIDYNIETTYEHTQKAVVHLEGANQAASSPFAQKVIKILAVTIILFAILLGLKHMN